jgi:glucose/arabinose dehydrogenase
MKLGAFPIRLMGRKRIRSTILTASLSGLIFLRSAASWGAVAIKAEPVVTGLSSPVDITHAGDGSGRLFIILQGGRIVIFDGVQILSPPFLDITSLVSSGGERGLLGAAFHPNYGGNGFFYVSYTDSAGDSVIARYSVSLDPNRADSTSGVILLTIPQPFSNHNGGQLHFGPDGYLYIGIGDGGSGGDPQNNGQDLGTLLGKIIRIDVDSGLPFTVPPDNPFVGIVGAREEIWSYGLRNPWRFSFDRLTGDMFIGDVGQGSWEEVDFQPANSTGGENYGWRLMEGNSCFNPTINCNDGTLTLPILVYDHSVGCSVTGGYRYRGSKNPALNGVYLYGDYCAGLIWGAQEDGLGGWNTTVLLDTNFLISTFGEDESGELYVADFSSPNGAIYQIVQANSASNASSSSSGGGGGCFIATAVHGSQKVMGVWARFVLKLFSPFRNLTI